MKKTLLIFASSLMLLAIPVLTCAQSETGYYLRLSLLNSDVGGDFDQGWRYGDEDTAETIHVPVMEQGNGFGITLGGYRGRLSGELSYFFSDRDSYIYDGATWYYVETYYDNLSLDVKYAFVGKPADKMSIYGLLGVGLPRFKVKDGAYNEDTAMWLGEYLNGTSYSLGIGCTMRFNSKINLNIDYIVRRIDIFEFDTAYSHSSPEDDLRAVERLLNVGVNYCF